ncbi:MAG TPA: MATE family efflux transporter [Gemmatimonadaceae bacterium]|nr:MATE family efflux transporter [Gemmatimonadaceae bacterium]
MSENALFVPPPGRSTSASEWRALLSIAVPVVVVQVGMMLMGVVDTLMVGRVSANALAAVALGNLYFFNTIVISMGALMALDPLVAQAVGANDQPAIARAVQRGIVLALFLGILTTIGMLPVGPALRMFRQPAEVTPDARLYVHIGAASMIPFLLFVVLRQTLQALHRIAPIVITIVAANLLNVFLNWALIFGHLGAPKLGVAGAAIATVIGRWFMFVGLLVVAWKEMRPYLHSLDRSSLALKPLRRMLALGLPIGLQQFLEYSAFAAVGLMMGAFGALQVAAHQIALNLAALTFMVPLGVAAAASVRVGHAIGSVDAPRARRAARLAYFIGTGFMLTTATLFLVLPRELSEMYTPDTAVIGIAATLIPIAGLFQVFDGLQAVGAGVLRGLGDTRVPLIAMLSGYWLIGIPVSVLLGFRTGMGPEGLWWGFVAGLASVAIFLLLRVRVLFRRGVTRIDVDAPPSH